MSPLVTDIILWIDVMLIAFAMLAIASIPSVLVQRAGRPMAALAWILAMIALPPVGLLLWWTLGRRHLVRQRRKRRAAATAISEKLQSVASDLCVTSMRAPVTLLPLRRLPPDYQVGVFPATCGNRIDLLVDAQQAYPAMLEAIEAAEQHIHLLFYIWNDDTTGRRFLELLERKARQGVEVRLLADGIGSPRVGRALTRPLERAGGQVARFLPPRLTGAPTINFRNHRKILVVDGSVGFTGGINVGDEYLGAWHDLAVRVRGPAVDQLQEVFTEDWYFAQGSDLADPKYFGRHRGETPGSATCEVVTSGPDSPHEQMQDVLFISINEAKERVFVMSPYFIPNPPILAALRSAVYRGVDVRILLPGRSDVRIARWASRSFYPELLGAPIRLFEYQAGILHAKAVVFDHELSLVGSANINNRSFRLNFEASVLVGNPGLNAALADLFERNCESSTEIALEAVLNRSWKKQMLDSAAHLLSPVL